jgi:glycopeptide antibiotics resistance protein/uncharacterized RDD family membrane protein YckC
VGGVLDPYLLPVRTAAAVFPILALVLLVPFSFVAYRRRGRLGWLRSLIFFSFVYFAVAAFFLTLMPLPRDPLAVCRMFPKAATPQLVPGNFVADFATEAHGNYSLAALAGNPALYQVGLNVVLLLPLGVFLRYYAARGLAVTTAAGLGTSLLFELTQGTGVWGLYPCPYRLADVDDLLLNTGGAMLGWLAAGRVVRVLPDLVARDEAARRTPAVVVGRRLWAFAFDATACLLLTAGAAVIWLHGFGSAESAVAVLPVGTVALWFVVIPLVNRGATAGKRLVRLTLVARDGTGPAFGALLLRYLPLLAPAAAVGGLVGVSEDVRWPLLMLSGLVGPAAVVSALVVLLREDRLGPHELLSGVHNACRRPRHRFSVQATMLEPTSKWTGASAAASGARRSPSRSTFPASGPAPRASMASSAAPTTGGSVTTVTLARGA